MSLKNHRFAPQFRSFVDHELNGCQELKQSFQKLSSSPEGFFFLRNNFLVSHGTSSVVSWIMSIGDRHADNLLISKISGESIQIDFGHAFGSACFLPIPELGLSLESSCLNKWTTISTQNTNHLPIPHSICLMLINIFWRHALKSEFRRLKFSFNFQFLSAWLLRCRVWCGRFIFTDLWEKPWFTRSKHCQKTSKLFFCFLTFLVLNLI